MGRIDFSITEQGIADCLSSLCAECRELHARRCECRLQLRAKPLCFANLAAAAFIQTNGVARSLEFIRGEIRIFRFLA